MEKSKSKSSQAKPSPGSGSSTAKLPGEVRAGKSQDFKRRQERDQKRREKLESNAPKQADPKGAVGNRPLHAGAALAYEAQAEEHNERLKQIEKEQKDAGISPGDGGTKPKADLNPAASRSGLGFDPAAGGLRIDQFTRRDDSDALQGHFCVVIGGEHAGRKGVFTTVASTDDKSGYPDEIIVETRDEDQSRITVSYDDVVPAEAGR